MDLPFHIPFVIAAAIVGLVFWLIDSLPSYMKLLPYFLIITCLLELFAWRMVGKGFNTAIYYNFYSVLTFVYYWFIIFQLLRSGWVKRILIICMIVYPIAVLLNLLLLQGFFVFNTLTYSIGALISIIFCVYFFYELFRIPHSINLKKYPGFWIVTGIFFFNACALPFVGLANYIAQFSFVLINNLQFILRFLSVLLYVLFSIAFLCRISFRRYTL
jgi:hypothetical protein